MLKNHIDVKLKHEKFIAKVCETSIVYALENEEGFATSFSNDVEDDDGEEIGVICFWSDKSMANTCAKEDWDSYKVVEIKLATFMEDNCIGIDNDQLLIGTNFDQNMFGYEIEGYELILELLTELKKNKQELALVNFKNADDFERQVRDSIL
jgi:Protein of unknown function (DUF2750)